MWNTNAQLAYFSYLFQVVADLGQVLIIDEAKSKMNYLLILNDPVHVLLADVQ